MSRRVASAGESKGGIDPYMPMRAKDKASQKRLLKEIHDNFIADVREGRGDRLKPEVAARLHVATAGGGGCSGALFGRPSKRTIRGLAKEATRLIIECRGRSCASLCRFVLLRPGLLYRLPFTHSPCSQSLAGRWAV